MKTSKENMALLAAFAASPFSRSKLARMVGLSESLLRYYEQKPEAAPPWFWNSLQAQAHKIIRLLNSHGAYEKR